MERTATAQHLDEQTEEPDRAARVASLKGTVLAGANGPEGRRAADELAMALKMLAVRSPTLQTRDLLQGILDRKELDGFNGTDGISCRAAVINAQVALGFPYALEVAPDDLVLLREATRHAYRPRHTALVAGALSLVWNAGFVLLLGVIASSASNKDKLALVMAPFVIGAAHALAALVTGARSKPNRRAFQVLAWMGLLGPLFTGIAALEIGIGGLVAGVIAAAPAMFTAMRCGQVAAELAPEEK